MRTYSFQHRFSVLFLRVTAQRRSRTQGGIRFAVGCLGAIGHRAGASHVILTWKSFSVLMLLLLGEGVRAGAARVSCAAGGTAGAMIIRHSCGV